MRIIYRPSSHGASHQTPNRIIVHAMAERIAWPNDNDRTHAVRFLERYPGELSAHVLISSDGGTIIQCRRDNQGANHAKDHNINSLGVELLVSGVYNLKELHKRIHTPGWCSMKQIDTLRRLVVHWCSTHAIKKIERHSDIDPSRKEDPGNGFPWAQFVAWVNFNLEKRGVRKIESS